MLLKAAYTLIGWHVSQSHGAVSKYTCASSSTTFILYGVARYSTYVPSVPRAVQFVHHMLTLGSKRTEKAFCNRLRYFVFVYQRAHSYKERMHAPLLLVDVKWRIRRNNAEPGFLQILLARMQGLRKPVFFYKVSIGQPPRFNGNVKYYVATKSLGCHK